MGIVSHCEVFAAPCFLFNYLSCSPRPSYQNNWRGDTTLLQTCRKRYTILINTSIPMSWLLHKRAQNVSNMHVFPFFHSFLNNDWSNGQTNKWMDGQTDKTSYAVACLQPIWYEKNNASYMDTDILCGLAGWEITMGKKKNVHGGFCCFWPACCQWKYKKSVTVWKIFEISKI